MVSHRGKPGARAGRDRWPRSHEGLGRRPLRFGLLQSALLCGALLAAGCGGGDAVRVLAAASLTDVLPSIVERYRAQHPGVEFELTFAGSQTLATQIEEGADGDLFISANRVQAQRLLAAGLAERPLAIAENRLVVAVRLDAPWGTLAELAADGARIAIGAPSVPVGELTRQALDAIEPALAERLRSAVVTEDPTVRVVLSRAELGEVDAAFVYHTDLLAAPGLRAIELPAAVPRNEYVAMLISGGDGAADERAVDFLAFLAGEQARLLLGEAGFLLPRSQNATPAATDGAAAAR